MERDGKCRILLASEESQDNPSFVRAATSIRVDVNVRARVGARVCTQMEKAEQVRAGPLTEVPSENGAAAGGGVVQGSVLTGLLGHFLDD